MACTECRRRQVKVSNLPSINEAPSPQPSLTATLVPAVHPFRFRQPVLRAMRKAQDQMRIHVHSGAETPHHPR